MRGTDEVGFLIAMIWVCGIPVACFCEVVRQKVKARRERREFEFYDVMPSFVLWPAILLWFIVRVPVNKLLSVAVDVTDSIADKIEGQEESQETLLRASRNPK